MPANAIDYITIRGFKSLANVEKLELRPINVLIGANGSGKSNFLGVFGLLDAVLENRVEEYVLRSGGANKLLHFGSKQTPVMSVEISLDGGDRFFRPNFAAAPSDRLALVNAEAWAASEASTSSGFREHDFIAVQGFERWRVYHFEDTSTLSPMRKTATVDDNRYLRPDASNLAAFLYLLQERYADSFSLIVRTIQIVAPFFDQFRLKPLELNPNTIKLEWRHKNSELYFDVSSLSDGTLRFIALATLFLQPDKFRPAPE